MHICDALARFLLQLRADGRSEHTVRQYARHIRALERWLVSERLSCQIEDVDDQVLARFLTSPAALRTPGNSAKRPSSTNALRTSVRCLFGYLHQAGWTVVNPARLVRRAITSPPPPRALRQGEQDRLLGTLRAAEGFEAERDRVLVELMLATGLRLSSALALDVEDLDLDEGTIRVRVVKRGREMEVYLSGAMCELLRSFLDGRRHGPVFASREGRRLSPRHAQRRFASWRDRAGVAASATSHSCRHAFALAAYERCSDLGVVQKALGHESITSTLIYAAPSAERVRAVVLQGRP